jgi:hypothetical protein
MLKYIFMDTNVFLHFKPIEEFKLSEQWGKCCLVVPRVILGELNKHKDSNKSSKIQKRARAICKKIQEWDKSGQITENLKFEFVINTSDPKKHGLNSDSPDDRFLSDILLFDAPSEDKILLAYDTNMLLTAKHLGIFTQEINENLKLPTEPCPLEKEKQELQRKLNRLENALPKLVVGCVSDANENVDPNPVFQYSIKEEGLTDEEIDRKVSNLKLEEYKQEAITPFMSIYQRDIEAYNASIRAYPKNFRKYLNNIRNYYKQYIFSFTNAIFNMGTAPAHDLDIKLHFPDGFEMYLEENYPSPPKEPCLPEKPSLQSKLSLANLNFSRDLQLRTPNIQLPKSYSLKRTNSYNFKDSFDKIKHNEIALMPKLFLSFKNIEEIRDFQCTYIITVGNLPEPVNGVINFRFEKNIKIKG